MGKILRVDLSSGKIHTDPLDDELMHKYIGGRGINSKLLFDETNPETDPFGEENRVIIGTSPLTGTIVPTSSRFTITSKSPLTGIHGDANSGGSFAPEIKYAGYDFIIIQGISEKKVYLLIEDDRVVIKNADSIWGKTTHETDRLIKDDNKDQDIKVLSIGLAGENRVKIAGIVTGFNIAARCGLGAVMGAKKLKAIAVKGTQTIKISDSEKCFKLIDKIFEDYKKSESWKWYPKLGWTTGLAGMASSGCSPIKNYLISGGQDAEKRKCFLNVESSPKYHFKDIGCQACPLACNKWIHMPKIGKIKAPVPGTGHMSIWEVYDYDFHVEVIDLCEKYGMDIYSIQNTISAAMEWYESGIISKKDADNLEITFGNKNAVIKLIHKIAKREGFGDVLAEGSIGAGKILGANPNTTPTGGYGKGMDQGPIDSTSMSALTLACSVSTRGAGHLRCVPPMSWGVQPEIPEKWLKVFKNADAEDIIDKPWISHPVIAEIVTYFENICTSSDIAEICKNTTEFYYFYGFEEREIKDDLKWHAEWIEAVTGMKIDRGYLENIVKKILTIEKSYNVREGKLKNDDMPVNRFMEKRIGGPLDGKSLNKKEFQLLFDTYYRLHGWDPQTSIPMKKTLEELDLKFIIEDFKKRGISLV
ncbi:aldehyde ferredoxin oxidoreductase family protein [Actinomycetota bacterium]